MTDKRFTDDGIEEIENQSFTDNLTEKTYWIDNGLDEIVELLNELHEENERLRKENKSLKDANEGLVGTIAHFELEDLE
mgnify:CR=1 FL=1